MAQNQRQTKRLSKSSQQGAGMIEYILIVGLIAVALIVSLSLLGVDVAGMLSRTGATYN